MKLQAAWHPLMTAAREPPALLTWYTSPALVPNQPAFFRMNSVSFSVVHSRRHVAERSGPVVTAVGLAAFRDSTSSIICFCLLSEVAKPYCVPSTAESSCCTAA
jgi:hypothetical protein